MSGKLMGETYALDLPPHLREVLTAMCDHANDDGGSCFPGVGRLAWKLGITRRAVQKNIRQLEDRGLLQVVREADPNRATEYRICLDGAPRKSPHTPDGRHRTSRAGASSTTHREHRELSESPRCNRCGEPDHATDECEATC